MLTNQTQYHATFIADETIPAGARVKLKSGSAMRVQLADGTDTEIGTAILHSGKSSYAEDGQVGVKLINDVGSRTCIATAAFAKGDIVYRAADGRVDDSGTDAFGYALEDADAADDFVEVLHIPTMTEATAADGSITTAKIANGAVTTAKLANGDVTGAKLSTAANLRSIFIDLGTLATTGATVVAVTAPLAGTLTAATFLGKDALATDNTNYLTFDVTNKGQAGAGTTAMLSATASGTTKTTGGAAIAAYTARNCPLHATGGNAALAANDALVVTVTASGTLANTVTKSSLRLDYSFTA